MSVRPYLPSGQFALLVCSLFGAVGLVYGAQYCTKPHTNSLTASASDAAAAAAHANWEASLSAIQAQAGVTLPTPPDQQVVDGLLQAAQSSNVTDTVGKSLLVNLTNAKAQGLGDDVPTQNQLMAQAQAQLSQRAPSKTYTAADISTVDDSPASQKAYGNAVMSILQSHPAANMVQTLQIMATVTDTSDPKELGKLKPIEAAYKEVADQLALVPVPKTLSPFHLQLLNDYVELADSYEDMQAAISDPLRGLVGLQNYESVAGESLRVFTNISQALHKDGILFTKDEPGAAWAPLLSAQ